MSETTTESVLAISGVTDVKLAIKLKANAAKISALALAGEVVAVTDADGQKRAGEALRRIQSLIRETGQSHKLIKAPVLELGRRIDAAASTFTAELEAEKTRITGLVAEFQKAEMVKAENLRKMQDRLDAKRREDEERKLAEAKAEEERLQKQALQNVDVDDPEAERNRQASSRATAEREAQELKAREAQSSRTPVAAPPKARGVSAQKVRVFEVTDIHALYAARPDLVELTPKAGLINREINAPNLAKTPEIPGIAVEEDVRVAAR